MSTAFTWFFIFATPSMLSSQVSSVASAPSTSIVQAIEHATVIDPGTGPARHRDWTVVIRGSEIIFSGPASEAKVPLGAIVHDERGKFVLPGLWDAHVHLTQVGANAFPLFLKNGVTSVRDMGSRLSEVRAWQAQRAAGAPIPRIFTSGPKLDGPSIAQHPDNRIVHNPEEARVAVEDLKAEGVNFIKVHERMTPDIYVAIAAESKKVGLQFAGHIPVIGPVRAAEMGQRTIEHGAGNGNGMLPCSAETWNQLDHDSKLKAYVRLCAPISIQSPMFPAFVRYHTWYTPTLVSWRGHLVGTPDLPKWKTLSGSGDAWPALQQYWTATSDPPPNAFGRQLTKQFPALAAAASHAGVHLLAGSDLGDPYVIPGYSLQDELALMVKAGVLPLNALQSATSEPAEAFGLASSVGFVNAGYAADLIVLNADPLTKISNLRSIDAVVLNGKWIPNATLDALR